jgi:hypothetical protein
MESEPTRPAAALGFRVHSGWAALVAVAGLPTEPVILDRQRIELVETRTRDQLQPYHAAAELDLRLAEAFLKRCLVISQAIAIRALGTEIERLREKGYRVAGCGLLLRSGRPGSDLPITLQSHALIHAAEGHFFRQALWDACRHHQLTVTTAQERGLFASAAEQLCLPPEELKCKTAGLGRSLGPPWTQDQKLAALIAWLTLARCGVGLGGARVAAG